MASEQYIANLFAPIKDDLVRIILESWRHIHSSDLYFKARSRACLMWDETYHRANIAWAGQDQIVHIQDRNEQTAHYWLDETTFFRIKKGDNKGFTRNYPTQAALEFYEEESDMFGGVVRLDVTYVLSKDESAVDDIAVVHRSGDSVDFKFSLLDENSVQGMPTRNTEDSRQEESSSVAKLKKGLEKKQEKPEGHE